MAVTDYALGPCQIEYGGEDLGKTNGGVTLTVEETFAPLNTDQDGESPVDESITGTNVTIEGSLAEITLDNFASLYKTDVVGSAGGPQKVVIKPNVGTSLVANSAVLIVKPYAQGVVTTDKNKWITLHKAGFKATAALTFNATDQRTIAFTATGYPDDDGNILTFGDTAATA
jgi:hypothetical protein